MKNPRQIVRRRITSKGRACSIKMVTAGFFFLLFFTVIGCVPEVLEKAAPSPAPPEVSSEPKALPKPSSTPSSPSIAAEKTAETVSPEPAPSSPLIVAKKTPEAVRPAPAPPKPSKPLPFHLKAPEEAPEPVKPSPTPLKSPIVIYSLPENKKFHILHDPIKKAESCVTAKCHAQRLKENKYVHAPVATAACVLCHGDIAANPPYGLIRPGQDLCLACHKDMKPVLNQARFVHKPVKDNCVGCHNPHSAAESKVLLREAQRTICITCHEKATPDLINRIKSTARPPHKPVAEGKCTDCHAAHISNFKKLVKEGPKEVDLCFSCHKEMGANVKKAEYKHGPIRDGLCNTCHKPHTSSNLYRLKYYFIEKFYNPFDPKVYSLCFKCHKETVVLDKRTTSLTNFRNGDRNLHYLHVNREKGRTCLACHEVHAGSQERKIRMSTPFGEWNIPIKFAMTATGGSCAASCHVEKKYDRNKPFKLEIDVQEEKLAEAKEAK
jgi:predicted CXXCH cytochrome family protein